jgi:hypothetical protein
MGCAARQPVRRIDSAEQEERRRTSWNRWMAETTAILFGRAGIKKWRYLGMCCFGPFLTPFRNASFQGVVRIVRYLD